MIPCVVPWKTLQPLACHCRGDGVSRTWLAQAVPALLTVVRSPMQPSTLPSRVLRPAGRSGGHLRDPIVHTLPRPDSLHRQGRTQHRAAATESSNSSHLGTLSTHRRRWSRLTLATFKRPFCTHSWSHNSLTSKCLIFQRNRVDTKDLATEESVAMCETQLHHHGPQA